MGLSDFNCLILIIHARQKLLEYLSTFYERDLVILLSLQPHHCNTIFPLFITTPPLVKR